MAKLAQNVVLSPSRDTLFNEFVLRQFNVRSIKAATSVDELPECITRRGLLQTLNVRPVLDAEGGGTGTSAFLASGRRFQALSCCVE
jgi:ParB family chromosome partitioning protein